MLRRRTEGQGDDDAREGMDGAPAVLEAAEAGGGNAFLDPKLSRKILQQASKQLAEEESSSRRKGAGEDAGAAGRVRFEKTGGGGGGGGKAQARRQEDSEDDDSSSEDADGGAHEWDVEDHDGDEEEEDGEDMVEFKGGAVHSLEAGGLSEAEQRVVSSFMDVGAGERRTLADIIMDKIREKAAEDEEGGDGDSSLAPGSSALTPKVREVYTEIGKLLKTYTAGKLPKAFKILPSLANWEEVVYLTRPDEWTPHATYAATRIFASNLNAKLSQRFFNLILLEKCRDDIANNKNLNYHYYMALKKAMYKPGAFFKGILLPLIQSGDCTIREATIIGSVLGKVSIPVNHAAVVLLKLATARDYSASCSILLKTLLNKKYTLPYRVIDAVADYFVSFAEYEGSHQQQQQDMGPTLPVLWHQSLLVFAQRYKREITREDKERLREMLKAHQHHQITPEVRRELFSCPSRGELDVTAQAPDAGDPLLRSMNLA